MVTCNTDKQFYHSSRLVHQTHQQGQGVTLPIFKVQLQAVYSVHLPSQCRDELCEWDSAACGSANPRNSLQEFAFKAAYVFKKHLNGAALVLTSRKQMIDLSRTYVAPYLQ